MPGHDDVIRTLRNSGLRPAMPSIDPAERELVHRIANGNDAQVALAKQQMAMNERQLAANERNQEVAQAQWTLVYASDLYKFHRQCEKDGVNFDAEIDAELRAHILRVFAGARARSEVEPTANASGFVEHEPTEG